jgi:glycosyltransferase involved in cell wall biosynthesis
LKYFERLRAPSGPDAMKILLLNQCFYPDVVSTAQHLTDLAVRLAEEGHDVTVLASSRGYDNPRLRFPKREVWKKIKIRRLPVLGLGKKARWRRALDFASFFMSAVLRLLLTRRSDLTLAMTSPPLISFLGALFVRLKGGRFAFWVMDLNPDEAIAAGWLTENSFAARFFGALLRYSLRQAESIFVLDRFMKERLLAKGLAEKRIFVIPPWSHDRDIRYDEDGRRSFRARHGLTDKFVVMYSGNHSPCHPLDTLLEAAHRLSAQKSIVFCFIGGGSEHEKVRLFALQQGLENIVCLPYQPLDALSASLSAADLQVVVMGEGFAGIVHPCKIYNILAIGSPFLYIGPEESHVTDLLPRLERGFPASSASHGDVKAVVHYILESARLERSTGARQTSKLAAEFSQELLLPRLVQALHAASACSALYHPVTTESKARSA